ncbi:mediator of RNA polymerase II transcription subunit 10 [Phanerochaete sordida]|uniref:Mediator of RNA polymerase II transcription subunit 10 n=1 Tax=Phanerochaete sordida TaxID=48140 RepID=A0A9P3FWN7_9APHY|nr:mediator of RNA polymerase II transcription subunit 10 [Phanerochaete sordida]
MAKGVSTPAPDSPRSSESLAPTGPQGDLEHELFGLVNALYNLGTTVVSDLTKEKDKPGAGKQVGARVNDVVGHLGNIDRLSDLVKTKVPLQVLAEIDSSRNPMQLTRDRLERAATENQFMNGKIQAIKSYRDYYNEALAQSFPELKDYLNAPSEANVQVPPASGPPVYLNGSANGNGIHG